MGKSEKATNRVQGGWGTTRTKRRVIETSEQGAYRVEGGTPHSPEVQQLDQKQVRQAQEQLKVFGYNPGAVDGILGPRTKAALRQF